MGQIYLVPAYLKLNQEGNHRKWQLLISKLQEVECYYQMVELSIN